MKPKNLLILIFCIQKVSGDVNYTLIQGLNQVYNVANSKASTTTVKYLGLTNSSAKCADLCVAHAIRCWSFTWHNIPGNFYHQCFGILSPRGSRVYLATASNWKDPATYNQHLDRGELFPDLGTAGTEDP